jgi:16S rRNA processing protein RimM
MTAKTRIVVGTIVNTHGLKGELRILPDTDFQSVRFAKGKTLYVAFGETLIAVKVKTHRVHKGFDLLSFEGLEDINLVERWKSCALFADNETIRHLDPNEFHIAELAGRPVIQGGNQKGEIVGVRTYPQGDYLEIRVLDGSLRLVPFRDEFVLNLARGDDAVEIVAMEGLLE